jgi:putative aldouronate transport system permease protein
MLKIKSKNEFKLRFIRELPLHFMILPGFIIVLIFHYLPMAGIIIAFEKFIPAKGIFGHQKWIGLDNFKYVMQLPNFTSILWNTVSISGMKII